MNTRFLKGKTIELSEVTSNADIVCITETHIDDTIKNHQIFDYNSKLIYRNDRNISGGGVLIAVDHKFPTIEVTFNNPDNTELIFVHVSQKVIVGCYYRPQHNRCFNTLTYVTQAVRKALCDRIHIFS